MDFSDSDNTQKSDSGFPREAMLELIQSEDGKLELRDVNAKEDPLVSIQFSEQVQSMLGADVHMIGQHMIHAAIQTIMHKQMKAWHANVYDEEPEHYS